MASSRAPVSVIIPCYRDAATLPRAVRSAVDQTWPPEEIIIVDDASQDAATGAVLRELVQQFAPLLRVLTLEENEGPAGARNLGWDAATQPLIAFLDADDTWLPHKLERQVPVMLADGAPALSGHQWVFHREPVAGTGPPLAQDDADVRVTTLTLKGLLLRSSLSTPTVVLRRDLSERFDPEMRFSEDLDLWLRIIARHGPAAFLTMPLAVIHKPPFGASGLSGQIHRMEAGHIRAVSKILESGAISRRFSLVVRAWNVVRYTRRLALVGIRRGKSRLEH
jgi:glycosyltransferase involved in cell wall biosynthesis